ncbi:MAG: Fic family protein [bacterium]
MYIHENQNWSQFTYDIESITTLLASVRHSQGRLLGRMESLGFSLREEAMLTTLTLDILKSTEIEGETLNKEEVRSSIARKLGITKQDLIASSHNVDGVVEMMLDATQNYAKKLTEERLFGWHAALFPIGYSGMYKIEVAKYRTGEMQVVSGAMGREIVHYEAPKPENLELEMTKFLNWFNSDTVTDFIIKSAIAHFWFVTIHPFDDGNGRIARTIADMMLCRSDCSEQRFYSMSNQIQKERKEYYQILESTQKGDNNITAWITWYLECLQRALNATDEILESILAKAKFWEEHRDISFNERQIKIINRLFDGFDGKLTSSKWAKICKCSNDTALRDIQGLIALNILCKNDEGGRSVNYKLK